MKPTLLVIGTNHRTLPVEVRERFWIAENRRYEALHHLARAEGIDQVVILAGKAACACSDCKGQEPEPVVNQEIKDSHG